MHACVHMYKHVIHVHTPTYRRWVWLSLNYEGMRTYVHACMCSALQRT